MPFYIRKSISAGPFRFNLSKSGLGLSVGVRGLRIGTGPRGHYVHAGRGGLYYRSSIGRAGQRSTPVPQSVAAPQTPRREFYHPTVEMVEVESADVLQMSDSRFQTILDDLNGRASQFRLSWAGAIAGAIFFLVSGFNAVGFIIGVLLLAAGAYADSYRRSSVVFYDLEGEAHDAYLRLVKAFEGLASCAGKWHVAAGGAVRDIHTWKRNAGAGHLVSKSPTVLDFRTPGVMKSNVAPPAIALGKQSLYFMPDHILVEHQARFGAIAYDNLAITHQHSRFVEEGTVPGDARVVDRTWRFVNKNGGPDRRFKDNRQLPVCLYEAMHISSGSGLNELLEFSQSDVGAPFKHAVATLAKALQQTALRKPSRRAQPPIERTVAMPMIADQTDGTSGEQRQLLWENVALGMSLSDLVAAQPKARRTPSGGTLADGARVGAELSGYELSGQQGRVLFYFRNEALAQVTVAFGDEVSEQSARAVAAALEVKYGPPAHSKAPQGGAHISTLERQWQLPGRVMVFLVWMSGVALNVNYQPSKPTA